MKVNKKLIRQSIDLALQSRKSGNHPFGALLEIDGKVVLTGLNSVLTKKNPIGHAETNLLHTAIKKLSPDDLSKSCIYTSCEPCAMCSGTIYWAGIRKVVFALSAEELAKSAGGDFLIPCRDLFSKAAEKVEVFGPFLVDEAAKIHEGFWK